ncbi:MAG: hypothetical protein J1E16_03095 [Muribaculaceae bacterium]|nr:hypothetical protein [Muribaculaceae bacterium]
MMKRLISIIIISIVLLASNIQMEAQNICTIAQTRLIAAWDTVSTWCKANHVADGLDVGLSLGDMGLGIEVKTPVTKWVDLRAGVDWMPRFKFPMNFDLNTYADGVATGNFSHVAQLVYDNTGIEMDETVKMLGVGSMVNFKLLADIFPVPSNRHWHITAGFYAGTSMIGKAYNAMEEKPTLVGLNLYNRAYEYFTTLTNIFNVPLGGNTYMDPDLVEELQEKFRQYGRMGIHIGDFKDGTPYIMEPSPDGMVSAKAYVNHFKPYLGAGYNTDIDRDGRWHFGVDLGVLFWGGAPDVINHDYTTGKDINFTKDLINVRGKVGSYVRAIKSFPVFPVLAVRFSYTIL